MFIVLCLELVLRFVFGVASPPLYKSDDRIEYLLSPNQESQFLGRSFSTNEFSMRSPDIEPIKSAEETRILVFGDSIINGGKLTDQESLATTILADQLNEKYHPLRFYVGNVSAGSWGPANILEYINKYGLFEADLVIFVFSSHDLYDIPTFEPLDPDSYPINPPSSAIVELFKYLKRYLGSFSGSSDVNIKKLLESNRKIDYVSTKKEILFLIDLVTNRNIKSIMVFHPTIKELHKGIIKELLVYREIAKQKNIPFFALNEYYKNFTIDPASIYRDHIHLNSVGQKLLANFISGIIYTNDFPEQL